MNRKEAKTFDRILRELSLDQFLRPEDILGMQATEKAAAVGDPSFFKGAEDIIVDCIKAGKAIQNTILLSARLSWATRQILSAYGESRKRIETLEEDLRHAKETQRDVEIAKTTEGLRIFDDHLEELERLGSSLHLDPDRLIFNRIRVMKRLSIRYKLMAEGFDPEGIEEEIDRRMKPNPDAVKAPDPIETAGPVAEFIHPEERPDPILYEKAPPAAVGEEPPPPILAPRKRASRGRKRHG